MCSMSKKNFLCVYTVINCSRSHLFQSFFNGNVYSDTMSHQITKTDTSIYIKFSVFAWARAVQMQRYSSSDDRKSLTLVSHLLHAESKELEGKIHYICHHYPTNVCYSSPLTLKYFFDLKREKESVYQEKQ